MPCTNMMQWYKFVLHYLWIAPHVLLAVIGTLMFTRRMYKTFPVFFLYTIFETVSFLLRFTTYMIGPGLGGAYRYVYIVTGAGSTLLRFGIIQEIFNNVFHSYPRLVALATILTRWVAGILIVVAILLASYSSVATSDNLLAGIMLLDRSVAVIQAGLLVFLFLFSHLFGLSWRSYTFGIALGFGLFASTQLAYWAIRLTNLSENSKDLLDLLPTGSYHVSVLVWLGYLRATEKPVGTATQSVPELDQWSGELERTP